MDTEEQRYLIFKSIIDHHFDKNISISKENMYIMINNDTIKMRKTTSCVKLLVLCEDGSEQWIPLNKFKGI